MQKGLLAIGGAVVVAVLVGLLRDAILIGLRRGWLVVRSLRVRLAERLSQRTRLRFVPSGTGIEQQIDVDLRPQSPVNIEFSTEIPQISLWFNITNRSGLDLIFDRMLIEFWVGQPTIYSGSILRRFSLPAGGTEKDVYFPAHLAPPQQEQIRRRANDKGLVDEVSINLTAYFQSERGWFEVRRHINYRDVLVKGLPTPETKAQLPVQQAQNRQVPAPPQQKQYHPQPTLDQILASIAARQERQRKAERLRPLFTKALAAQAMLIEAVNLLWVVRKQEEALNKFNHAIAAFQPLRSPLSLDPEGEALVKIFDKALAEYGVLEAMIRNQEQLLAAHSSSAVEYAERVERQWKLTQAIENEMKQTVQETLKALGE